MQLRRGIIAVALTCKGQLEQGRCERALGRNGQERRPSRHPGGLSRRSEVRWDGGSSVAGQEAQEGGCFRAKAPTHFQGNDDQAAPPGTEELGVRAMSLAPRCCGDRAPRLNISLRVGLARTCERGDERGVNREPLTNMQVSSWCHRGSRNCDARLVVFNVPDMASRVPSKAHSNAQRLMI